MCIEVFLFLIGSAQRGPQGEFAENTRCGAAFCRTETATRGVYRPPSGKRCSASADNKTRIQTSRYVARAQRVVTATSRVYSVTSER